MSTTITNNSTTYCNATGHVRVWAGGPEAAPDTCACGNYRFVKCYCTCGNVHERMVMIDDEIPSKGRNNESNIYH